MYDCLNRRSLCYSLKLRPSASTYPGNDPDRLVTVKVFDSLTEAVAARALLEAADIDCFLADEHTYRIAGPFHAVFGVNGVRLQVRAEDLEQAVQMLTSTPPK